MDLAKLMKEGKISCLECRGRGYHSEYHNQTRDCSSCDGSGQVRGMVKIDLTELMKLVDDELKWAEQSPGNYLLLMHIYKVWGDL